MSKTNSFAGMGKVFRFTLMQNLKSKGFKIATAIVAIIIIGGFIAVNAYMATDDGTEVKKVFVLDETGMAGYDNNTLATYDDYTVDGIENVKFEKFDGDKDALLKKVCDENAAVGVEVAKGDNGLTVTGYIDENDVLDEKDGTEMAEYVAGYFDQLKIANAGLSEKQVMVLMTPVQIVDDQIGSDKGYTSIVLEMIVPMVLSLFLYMMLLIYGQAISKSVIAEKDSKLMEYILTSVKSQGLIAGKITAMVSLAIIQLAIWGASVAVGIFAGGYVGKMLDSDYVNISIKIIKNLKEETAKALTWYGIILAVFTFILGFLFFSTLAGLVASFAQKTEGLARMMIIYQYVVVAGFFIAYMGSFMENKTLKTLSNYIPICSPFSTPANILVASMSAGQIALSIGILLASTVVVVIITARVYSAMVLFNGAKLSPKVIKGAILGK